ncbi:MAG: flagellar FliJ family protein [Candidatus Zixiibacteriota bacterium]|nr:MAG: flagellar FliJ family protein [candidate division Zixibacteria bacterium]
MPLKKFRFRLEKLLQLKSHIESEKQKILALATQKVFGQKRILEDIDSRRITCHREQRHHLVGTLNPSHQLNYSRYYLRLKKEELAGRELLDVFKKEREKKRLDLVEATKQRRIYEKLKEHRQEAYRRETDLAEQKEQDELGSQFYLRKLKLPVG